MAWPPIICARFDDQHDRLQRRRAQRQPAPREAALVRRDQYGLDVDANYAVNAAIAGRPVIGSTAGTTSITVNVIEPNTVFLDYTKQLDLRVARNFRFDRYRIQGQRANGPTGQRQTGLLACWPVSLLAC
ncbi:MAG TPA: hypothetical protein VJ691_04260 [Vicinamibacterales bacterium]|nr:hypothetical protein [Vicinamibacterales bacterium]